MYELVSSVEIWLAVGIPILGLSSVFLARCTEHTAVSWPQKFMVSQLFLVGAAAITTLAHDGSCWWAYGVALTLMAVGATMEFSPQRKVSF